MDLYFHIFCVTLANGHSRNYLTVSQIKSQACVYLFFVFSYANYPTHSATLPLSQAMPKHQLLRYMRHQPSPPLEAHSEESAATQLWCISADQHHLGSDVERERHLLTQREQGQMCSLWLRLLMPSSMTEIWTSNFLIKVAAIYLSCWLSKSLAVS